MPNKLENIDPIKIKIPEELYAFFEQDAKNFEFYDDDKEKFSINKFLSALITGYFPVYHRKISGQYAEIKKILSDCIEDETKLNKAITCLIRSRAVNENRNLVRGKKRAITIRPNSENVDTITEINKAIRETDETQADFYRRMFDSFCSLPMYEREKLIYHKETEKIGKACKAQSEIVIQVRRNEQLLHYVIVPYKLVHGLDERFNYLLAQEFSNQENGPLAVTFRLSRVSVSLESGPVGKIEPSVLEHLQMMESYSPQYSINDDKEILIELTKAGLDSYRRIYHDRPHCTSMDLTENGKAICHFLCSMDQLYLYFRQFNPGEAVVLNSDDLSKALYDFHLNHLVKLNRQLGLSAGSDALFYPNENQQASAKFNELKELIAAHFKKLRC